jgi:hypothetical protein
MKTVEVLAWRSDDQIDRPVAEHLVSDVNVAALCVASLWWHLASPAPANYAIFIFRFIDVE